MMFNDTFSNISVISWHSVLLVMETGGPGENHRAVTDKLYHMKLISGTNHLSIWGRTRFIVLLGQNVVSSNPHQSEVYKHYVIKFVNDLQQVGGFLQFLPPTELTATI
jgi:hypothetical protein